MRLRDSRRRRRHCSPCDEEDDWFDDEMMNGIVLPPLPQPDLKSMRSEASTGCSVVGCIIMSCIGVTLGAATGIPERSNAERNSLVGAVFVEAAVALTCLAYLMFGDPGVLKRTRHSVLPIPAEVAEKLAAPSTSGDDVHPLSGMQNVRDNDRSYCVRCCLWRDEVERGSLLGGRRRRVAVHHCSTCRA